MFVVALDLKGVLQGRDAPEFLKGLRGASFGAIPAITRQTNELDPDKDCIAISLSLDRGSLIGRILQIVTSGLFPDFLCLICFSAKESYIPHDAGLISAIAEAAGEFLGSCGFLGSGTKTAAWAIPFPLGKWVATTAE